MARHTWDELRTAFADNTQGDITAGDMRDFVDSVSGHTAAGAPGISNDETEGFSPGSLWLDTTGPAFWVCVSAATGAAVWTQAGGGGGAGHYDLQLGFPGPLVAAAADTILLPRPVTIASADPGVANVGVNPSATVALSILVNATTVGTISISSAGTITWSIASDINLMAGDLLRVVAPSPADGDIRDILIGFKGVAL